VSRKSTAPVPRKVWRMNTNAPLGEVVTVESTSKAAAPSARLEIEEWPETNWTTSSFALLSGCEVKDYTARIPEQVFDRLFKD
jgi:hypothetical protein